MFWKTDQPHGLPRNPFKSCIIPRPIGWISTQDKNGGVNLAPYSYFNGVSDDPPMVMFASGSRDATNPKDTIANAEATGEFVCSMVSWDMRDVMNTTSAEVAPEIDEFKLAGIETAPSQLVKPPRVAGAPIHLECTYLQTFTLPPTSKGHGNAICVGRVIGIHIKDEFLKDGFIDVLKIRPVARLGYMDYTSVDGQFTMLRPTVDAAAD
ncbi:MAG: flavin reductase family protein [Proteobacteria bacterium]|nr:flavin reductase family protein [Pseudomonadota bacterium]